MTIFKKHDIFLCYHLYNKDKNDSRSSYLKALELKELLEKQGFNCYLLDPESSVQAYKETVKEVRNSTCFLLVINNGIIEKCQNLGKDEATGEIHYSLKEDTRCHEEIEAFVKKYLTSVIAHNWAMCYCDCSQEDFSDRQISLLRDDMLFDCQNYSRDWDRLLEWAKAKKQEAEEKERLEAEKAEKKRQEEEEAKRKKEEAERKEQESSYGKTLTDAEILYFREGRESDPQNIKDLREKACDGDKDAQFQLAEYYNDGKGGVKIDKAQSEYWYKQAADNGHVEAMFKLGETLNSFNWYFKAAEAGHARAQYVVGAFYDRRGPYEWYNFRCEYSISEFYASKNDEKAIEWYEKASKQGLADATYNLGEIKLRNAKTTKERKQSIAIIKSTGRISNLTDAIETSSGDDYFFVSCVYWCACGVSVITGYLFWFIKMVYNDKLYLESPLGIATLVFLSLSILGASITVILGISTFIKLIYYKLLNRHIVFSWDWGSLINLIVIALMLFCTVFPITQVQIRENAIVYEINEDDTLSVHYEYFFKSKLVIPEEIDGKTVTVVSSNKVRGKDKKLKHVELPTTIKEIGDNAFSDCVKLKSIKIPDSVTSIGKYAFSGCSSLTSIEIPSSVTSIGGNAFSGCSSLTSIEIPGSVTSIGSYAFENCSSLTSIEIPSSVTSIYYGAFYRCSSLTIYCEAESKPSGWDSDWNYSNRPVVWGHKGSE